MTLHELASLIAGAEIDQDEIALMELADKALAMADSLRGVTKDPRDFLPEDVARTLGRFATWRALGIMRRRTGNVGAARAAEETADRCYRNLPALFRW